MKWHVIHTKVREEFRALENLQNQGFEVFLPTCQGWIRSSIPELPGHGSKIQAVLLGDG